MSDATLETFTVRINNGEPRAFDGSTGMYKYAALQAVLAESALLPLPGPEQEPIRVEIWADRLLPDYGPYSFLVWEDSKWDGHIYIVGAYRKAAGVEDTGEQVRAQRA